MPKRITVIGSANVDFVMPLPSLPRKGESVTGGPFVQSFGGKGSNQALAARRAGGEVTAVMCLGEDPYSEQILDVHRAEGIDISHVVRQPNMHCGVGMILVDGEGENAIGTDLGANACLSIDQINAAESIIADSGMLLMQMEIDDAALLHAAALAKRHHIPLMLNYAPARVSVLPLDNTFAMLVANENEAGALTNMEITSPAEAETAATILAENGHTLIIITLGEKGCVVWESARCIYYPAFTVDAVDTTGAGDAFCGALAVGLMEAIPLPTAIRFASAAGALSATRLGAMPSLPRRVEIDAFLAEQS